MNIKNLWRNLWIPGITLGLIAGQLGSISFRIIRRSNNQLIDSIFQLFVLAPYYLAFVFHPFNGDLDTNVSYISAIFWLSFFIILVWLYNLWKAKKTLRYLLLITFVIFIYLLLTLLGLLLASGLGAESGQR